MVQGQLALLVAARRSDQADALVARPLAGNQAHAPGGGMEQHRIPPRNRHGAAEQVDHRHPLEHHRSTFVERDAVGQGADLGRGHRPRCGVGPRRVRGIGHAVAGPKMHHTLAHRRHNPCGFHAHGSRKLHRVQARPLVYIDEVKSCGMLLDGHLARCRGRHLALGKFKDLRPAMGTDDDGTGGWHGAVLSKTVGVIIAGIRAASSTDRSGPAALRGYTDADIPRMRCAKAPNIRVGPGEEARSRRGKDAVLRALWLCPLQG